MLKKLLNSQALWHFFYVVAFIAFFWVLSNSYLRGGYVIAGHDSGLPLDTGEFLKTRFYSWDERVGFGQDNSSLFGSISLHSIDYVLAFLSASNAAGTALAITFWLSLIFISAFIFAYSFRKDFNEYFVYLFPPLITINFYVFQSLFILERAKYELLSAMLLFVPIVFKVKDRQISILSASILTALIFSVLNGGGWFGLPLYGGVIIFALTFLGLELILNLKTFVFFPMLRMLGFYALTVIIFLLLNSYSILPYIITFRGIDASLLNDLEIKRSNIEWIGSLSHGASFLNLFRMQGVPDWYSNHQVISPGHPFALIYTEHPLLVILSFFITVLALISFFVVKEGRQKKIINYFWIVTLVGMFFAAGTHPPLKFLYELIYNYVPGFVIFRSPFYKFGSLFFIGLSVLVAFSISEIIKRFNFGNLSKNARKAATVILMFIFIFGWLSYHYKLYSPDIFSWQKGFSSRTKPPPYIYEFNKYINQNIDDGRVLLLPPFNNDWKNDGYTWGYWSLSTVPYSLSSKNFLVNGFGLTEEEREWTNKLYSELKNKNEQNFLKLAEKLNVKYVLFRSDASAVIPSALKIPVTDFQKIIWNLSSVNHIKNFGNWSLYGIKTQGDNRFSLTNSVGLAPESDSYLSRDFLENIRVVLLPNNDSVTAINDEISLSENLEDFARLKASSLDCSTCFLEKYEVSNQLPEVTIRPDSALYRFKVYRENLELKNASNDQSKISSYLAFILRRTAENFKLISFGAKERYLKSNSDTINMYLDKIYDLIKNSSDPTTDYSTALRVLSGVGPVENNLKLYIQDKEFLIRGEEARFAVLDTLMKIYRIKKYYDPLLKEIEHLRKEKRYIISSIPGNANIYLRISTFPKDEQNNPLYPSEINFQQGTKSTKLALGKNDGLEWFKAGLNTEDKQQGYISVIFDNLTNLYQQQGTNLEITPTGQKNCLLGKIKYFDPLKTYEVNISSVNKDQIIKLLFKDENKDQEFNFLIGRPEVNIFPILTYEPFRYLFKASSYIKDPIIYICSENKELPEISKIEIFEVTSPQLIIVEEKTPATFELPSINVKKQNPTKYTIEVKNAKDPFILILNQRYSPLWKLSEDGNEAQIYKQALQNEKDSNHIKIDGYANGWIIKKTGNYSLTVEYIPQIFFSLGLKITAAFLIICVLRLIAVFVRKFYRSKRV